MVTTAGLGDLISSSVSSILIMMWTYFSIKNPWIIIFGLIMITSSSIYIADDMTSNPFYFAQRH